MNIIEWADTRVRQMSVWELAAIKWSCIAAGVLAAQKIPAVQRLNPKLVAAVMIGLAAKPAVTLLRGIGTDDCS